MTAGRGATAKARPRIESEEDKRKRASISHGMGASMLILYPQGVWSVGRIACALTFRIQDQVG